MTRMQPVRSPAVGRVTEPPLDPPVVAPDIDPGPLLDEGNATPVLDPEYVTCHVDPATDADRYQPHTSEGACLPQTLVAHIIGAYDDWVVRVYAWGRFRILRQRFLEEIGQYLPIRGRVLDIGCGFGLFSLYYASKFRGLQIDGFDINARRVTMARKAAVRLGLGNVHYEAKDARSFEHDGEYDAAYMLDIIHHVPFETAEPLLSRVCASLAPGGILLVKDVDTHPTYKRLFTRVLDWALDPKAPVRYWPAAELHELLEKIGFRVHRHKMIDILPYPHMLYICVKPL